VRVGTGPNRCTSDRWGGRSTRRQALRETGAKRQENRSRQERTSRVLTTSTKKITDGEGALVGQTRERLPFGETSTTTTTLRREKRERAGSAGPLRALENECVLR